MSKKKANALINEEIIADTLGKNIGSQEYIRRLIDDEPSIAKNIYDWGVNKVANNNGVKNEKAYWNNVKNNFEKAYNMEWVGKKTTNEASKNDTKFKKRYPNIDNIQSIDYNNLNQEIVPYIATDERKAKFTQYGQNESFYELDYETMEKAVAIGSEAALEAQRKGLNSYSFNDDKYVYDFEIIDKSRNTFGITKVEKIKTISEEVYNERETWRNSRLSNGEYKLQEKRNNYDNQSVGNTRTSEHLARMDEETRKNRLVYNEKESNRNTRTQELDNSSFSNGETRYSLSDNQGRALTKEQQEWSKDSKVRDNNGNLKVLYNGSGNHTVYLPGYMSEESLWGKGIYLTPYKDIAEMYGNDIKETYVNITKPMSHNTKMPFEQYNEFYKAVYDGEEAYHEEYDMYDNDFDLLWDATNKGNWADYANELKKYTGYDGIIAEEIDGDKSSSMVIAFQSNQVKLVNNEKPTDDPDIRYSLSGTPTQDNKGRELSKGQQEYFKNSQAKDENGNLMTTYHGTTEEINVFKKDRLGSNTGAASAGQGCFFTSSKEVADAYSMYARPIYIKELEAKQEELKKIAEKERTNEAWNNYYRAYEEYEEAELDYGYGGRSDYENTKEVYLNITNPLIHDFKGEAYRDESYYDLLVQAQKNGNDGAIFLNTYDGYGDHDSWTNPKTNIYVVFDSNQIKNVDNINPTSDEDIRKSQQNDGMISDDEEIKKYIPSFEQNNDIKYNIKVSVENDLSLKDFNDSLGDKHSLKFYSNSFSWIKVCGTDEMRKEKVLFDDETA